MSLSDYIEYTEKGGVYTVSRFGVEYISSIETSTPPPVKTDFKKIKFEKVKWDTKDGHITIIDTKVEEENLEILGAVKELKTNDIVIVKYSFNSQLILINEEEIVRTQTDEKNYPEFNTLKNDK
jgi:hypothetical protein